MLRVQTVITGRPGSPGYSNLYFGGSSIGEATVAVAQILDFWNGIKGFMTSGSTIRVSGEVEVVSTDTGLVTGVLSVPDQTVTTTGNAPLSPALQGLVRWRTGDYVAGREIRGRLYVPWLAADANSNGALSTPFLTQLVASAANLVVDAAGAGGLAVYSHTHHQYALVSSSSVWNQFAVMRSRRD